MQAAVITFPASNCDRDLCVALARAGASVDRIWHEEATLKAYDLIGIPGGFSFGDYLRCGAISARSPVMRAVVEAANRGTPVIGICNGFQILTECGLLPGALIRNAGLKFVCRPLQLEVRTSASIFTKGYALAQEITLPVAHHDGNFTIDDDGLKQLQDQDRIAFAYKDNPNGATADIAGILNKRRNVLGMMPHPERAADPQLGMTDGTPIFDTILQQLG